MNDGIDITEFISLHDGPDGFKVRVFENSHTVCTEQPLSAAQATKLAVQLLLWAHPTALVEPKPEPVPAWPEFWPPQLGETWRDQRTDLWACMGNGKLVCLASYPDGPTVMAAQSVEEDFGPLVRVTSAPMDEVPF